MRLRVLVVDDHEVIRAGVRSLLARQPWVERCVPAHGGDDAAALARRFEPHVALVGIGSGAEPRAEAVVEIVQRVRAAWPATRIVLLVPDGIVVSAVVAAARAVGVVSQAVDGAALAASVRRAALGDAPRAPSAGAGVHASADRAPIPPRVLSAREREVLRLIAGGATNREIAAALQLSPHTVKQHASTTFRKLRARNRADAVRRGQQLGLLA